jgi:proline dehydrogenase
MLFGQGPAAGQGNQAKTNQKGVQRPIHETPNRHLLDGKFQLPSQAAGPNGKEQLPFTITSRISKPHDDGEQKVKKQSPAKAAGAALASPFKTTLERGLNKFFSRMPWVAGETAESAVQRALELNNKGSPAIICYLGEHITNKATVDAMVVEYEQLIGLIAAKGANASIAVRPSPFGSDVTNYAGDAHEYCWRNLENLISRAKEKGVFVWIDTESLDYLNYTLEIYKDFQSRHGNVGIVIQANVKRSEDDLRSILHDPVFSEHRPVVRLVKGIYAEKPEVSHTEWAAIHKNFSKLIKVLFEESQPGDHLVVATHQEGRILEAIQLSEKHPDKTLELQMLMGIKTHELAEPLRAAGHPMTEYVPYGPQAFPYCMRRMAKSPAFATMAVTAELQKWPRPVRAALARLFTIAYKLLTKHDLNRGAAHEDQGDAARLKEYLESKSRQK